MSWLANVMSGESKIRSELEELARRSRDESLPVSERLKAMFELGSAVQAGEKLQAAIDQLDDSEPNEVVDEEPKYKWVNGAKVNAKFRKVTKEDSE